MRMTMWTMAAVSALAVTAPAAAVQLRFDITDPSATSGGPNGYPIDNNTYSFLLDSAPTNTTPSGSVDFTVPTTIFYTVTYSPGTVDRPTVPTTITFFGDPTNSGVAGGLDNGTTIGAISYFGPQIFLGDNMHPTFQVGSYALSGDSTLRISLAASGPVPEPAAWTMLVAGFGLVGGAMRGRRRTIAFA